MKLVGTTLSILWAWSTIVLAAERSRVTHPPTVGGVDESSALIGFRVFPSSSVSIRYSTDAASLQENDASTVVGSVETKEENDYTATIHLNGLSPNTQYFYRIVIDELGDQSTFDPSVVSEYSFRTMPPPGQEVTVAVFADLANQPSKEAPAYSHATGAILALQIGDFDHSDPGTNGTIDTYRTLAKKLRSTRTVHGTAFATHILSQMAFDHIWDDHDYCYNDSDQYCETKEIALQVYKEYYPGFDLPTEGIYHKFTVSDAEFFMLDTRYFRVPDDYEDDEAKTMLGFEQRQWLLDGIIGSSATWKIIVSTVNANMYARPTNNDHWKSFQTEASFIRNALLEADAFDNVVMISGDLHSGGAVDDGSNNWFGLPELGVAHTNLDEANGNVGTWSEGASPGSNGGGYATVRIDSETLTLSAHLAETGEVLHTITLDATTSTSTQQGTESSTSSPSTASPSDASCLANGEPCFDVLQECCSGRCGGRRGICRPAFTSRGGTNNLRGPHDYSSAGGVRRQV